MNSILCPVDFSDASLNALEFAARIGEKNQSTLQLLYVFNEDEFNKILDLDVARLSYKELMARAEKKLEALAKKTMKMSGKKGLVACDYEVYPGKLSTGITDYAAGNSCHLIVMGTNGVSDVREAFVGSNTLHVIDKANCPVLCVPMDASFNGFSNIVYASDYQEEDKLAIQQVVALAVQFDSRIHVLHVDHDQHLIEKAIYKDFIEELRSFIKYDKVSYDVKIYRESVSRGIEEYMNETGAELLVVLRRNRNLFERLFHKSITKKLSYLTDHPLLAIKLS